MKVFAVLFFAFAGWFVEAWGLMVAAGMVRADWLTSMPPMGYGTALVVSLALSVFLLAGAIVSAFVKAAMES